MDLVELLKKQFYIFKLSDDDVNYLYKEFINTINELNIDINNLKIAGEGESSLVFDDGNQVIKICFTEYYGHCSLKEYVSHSESILQPTYEKLIKLKDYTSRTGYTAKIILTEKLSLDNVTNQDLLDVYVKLRDDGYLWYDTSLRNIGKDKNGKALLLDYGELIYINDMDEYQKNNELISHKMRNKILDKYYESIKSNKNISKSYLLNLIKKEILKYKYLSNVKEYESYKTTKVTAFKR